MNKNRSFLNCICFIVFIGCASDKTSQTELTEGIQLSENGDTTKIVEYSAIFNIWKRALKGNDRDWHVEIYDNVTKKLVGSQLVSDKSLFYPNVQYVLDSVSLASGYAYVSAILPERTVEHKFVGFTQKNGCDLEFADAEMFSTKYSKGFKIPLSNAETLYPFLVLYLRFEDFPVSEVIVVYLPSYYRRFSGLKEYYDETSPTDYFVVNQEQLFSSYLVFGQTLRKHDIEISSPHCK